MRFLAGRFLTGGSSTKHKKNSTGLSLISLNVEVQPQGTTFDRPSATLQNQTTLTTGQRGGQPFCRSTMIGRSALPSPRSCPSRPAGGPPAGGAGNSTCPGQLCPGCNIASESLSVPKWLRTTSWTCRMRLCIRHPCLRLHTSRPFCFSGQRPVRKIPSSPVYSMQTTCLPRPSRSSYPGRWAF